MDRFLTEYRVAHLASTHYSPIREEIDRNAMIEQLESLIECIYASALVPALWAASLRQIAAFTGSRDCLFQGFRVEPTRTESLFSYGGEIDRGIFENHARFVAEYGDIRAEFGTRMPAGRVYHDRDWINDSEVSRHPYYQELLNPLGFRYAAVMACHVERSDDVQVALGFGLQRTVRQGPLAGDSLQRFEVLLPHLVRATKIARRFGRLTGLEATRDVDEVAVFDLDRRGVVVRYNAGAERLLRNGSVRLSGGRICLDDVDGLRALMRAMRRALERDRRGALSGRWRLGGSVWTFWVAPVPKAVAAKEPASDVSLRLRLWPTHDDTTAHRIPRLSRAESRLVAKLATGLSLRQAADAIGISYETGRTQIKCAMRRLGVRTQAALVAQYIVMVGASMHAEQAALSMRRGSAERTEH